MEWVTLRDDAFYQKDRKSSSLKDAELVELDTKVKGRSCSRADAGISYDKLMLATGSEPVRLPIERSLATACEDFAHVGGLAGHHRRGRQGRAVR